MLHKSGKLIILGVLVALLLPAAQVYAVKNFKISGYGGGHQIWFEAEEFDERNPDSDQYYPVVDQAGAFDQAISRSGGAGGMIRWTFDISTAGGAGGTWYFWARQINPSNASDYMLVEGDPDDAEIPTGPSFPGGDGAPFSNADDRVFEIDVGPLWGWAQSWGIEGHTKELQDGENTMYIFHRQGNDTVFWDVFVWTDDPGYVPNDDDYRNAAVILPGIAYAPIPADGATDVPRDAVLSWTAGDVASPINGHRLYFSENIDDISNGLGGITLTPSSYTVPQRLEFATTYYWRIDEITPDGTVFDGSVWSFTTELFAYPIQNITATASSSAANKGPENAVNGSGLDSNGLHGNIGDGTMWLSDVAGPQPAWILFELDTIHKLHEMLVWNSNESLDSVIGLGFKEVVIEYSTDGVDFMTLGTTHEFAQAPGSAGYTSNTTIDMAGVAAKYVKLTANSNWAGLLPQFGLSEVQILSTPVQAREPDPASGAIGVALDLDLTWRAGREGDRHDVYFSEDFQAVVDGTAPVTTVVDASHGPLSLDLGKTYFWRVDEVNDAETPSTWPGQVWNFMTIESLVVDDFEGYTDDDAAGQAIWQSWIDGFGVDENGSQAGYLVPPYAERAIVHAGRQSMPLFYDNTQAGVTYSEASLTLTSQKDWTVRGVAELSIWFRGYPASVGSFTEGPAGTYTIAASSGDIWNQADEFHYAYKQLSGVGSIIARVESVENTAPWAKAGVMIRETLDAGSIFAAVYIMPTNADGTPTNGCRFQGRTVTDGSATSDTSVATDEQKAIVAPYWVKIERDVAGNFRGSYSSDGTAWTPMVWRPAISMDSNVYIGLALTSNNNSSATCHAVFSSVKTEGNVTGQWQSQDIGIQSNSAEPMYVSIANSNGMSGLVMHDDPAAAQIDIWTEWRIDLQQFADQGVNLADVDSISVGLGEKNTAQPGGSGTMYFDDIGLYP